MLAERVVGQPKTVETIIPYLQMFQCGLSPEGRPVGVFLLLGPTGTGKTRTVEALAEVIHGSKKHFLKIDCGEYQMDHEVAKLIGAPPGYLGHRETTPMLNQNRLNAVTSDRANLSIVLFDEVEKAAGSLARLLLGVLDKGTLRLGDNTTVNFERSIIFLTSNLGAREMARELRPTLGFQAATASSPVTTPTTKSYSRLEAMAMQAVKRKFAPEFLNRIDRTITYQPLDNSALDQILSLQLDELQKHFSQRLGARAFRFQVTRRGRQFLLRTGTSPEYGARELKRAIHRYFMEPLAGLLSEGRIGAGEDLVVDTNSTMSRLDFYPAPSGIKSGSGGGGRKAA